MDGRRDFLAADNLLVGILPGRSKPSTACYRNRGCLGDDESTFRRTLRVAFEHQLSGNVAGLFRPRTRERCHDHAMVKCQRANMDMRQQLSNSMISPVDGFCLNLSLVAD